MPPVPGRAYSIAIVGCGYFGPNHMRVFNKLPGSKVSWMVDTDAGRLDFIARQFPDVRTTLELNDVLDDPTVDAVVVATPASTHAAVAIAAMRAGKHVLCEKPLATTVGECQDMIAAATRHKRVLMTGHVYLFHPAILEMKRMIADGSIGRPQYCSAERTNFGPVRTDVDAAWDLAAHEISIFNFLFDRIPSSVTATGRSILRPDVPDVVALTVSYPGGLLANILVSWLNHRKVRQLSVVGETRLVAFDDLAPRQLAVYQHNVVPRDEEPGPSVRAEPLLEQARHFLQALETGDAGSASAADGMAVVVVLEAVLTSLRRNGASVEIAQPVARAEAV